MVNLIRITLGQLFLHLAVELTAEVLADLILSCLHLYNLPATRPTLLLKAHFANQPKKQDFKTNDLHVPLIKS
jgi:hypothetical protein